MADDELRLERAWRASGSPEDEAALRVAERRAGRDPRAALAGPLETPAALVQALAAAGEEALAAHRPALDLGGATSAPPAPSPDDGLLRDVARGVARGALATGLAVLLAPDGGAAFVALGPILLGAVGAPALVEGSLGRSRLRPGPACWLGALLAAAIATASLAADATAAGVPPGPWPLVAQGHSPAPELPEVLWRAAALSMPLAALTATRIGAAKGEHGGDDLPLAASGCLGLLVLPPRLFALAADGLAELLVAREGR